MLKSAGIIANLTGNRAQSPAGSARRAGRSNRARLVELNGTAERIELLLLVFMAPLWGLLFPILGINTLSSFGGAILIGASLFCFVHFLHLQNNKLSFTDKGIRLPGVDHRLHDYNDLKRISIECEKPLVLLVEYAGGEAGKIEKMHVEAQHLTEESARALWNLCASHLRSCAISIDVRNRLVNWRTHSDIDPDKTEGGSGADAGANGNNPESAWASWNKRYENRESQIGRDLSFSVDLKPFNPIKLVGQYMASYSETFSKTWLTFWCAIAAIVYPASLYSIAAKKIDEVNLLSPVLREFFHRNELFCTQLGESLGKNANDVQQISWQSLADFFGNNISAVGLLVLVIIGAYKFLRHVNDPDSIFIDYLGITTQKRTPSGTLPQEHRSWKAVETMHLIRPNEKSNSSRWSILFACHEGKAPIEIPFKAFASDRARQSFLECLDSWGRNIVVDPKLLEALSPINQTSYTELWMSALSEAPKIDELTPHSIGLRLDGKDYEIVSQLASGGQGVAYLAKKTKSEKVEQVVLKETILPIYVDERARTRAVDRFNRDAKLLASLDHPMIVHLDDYFVENNRAYLALEYVDGKTLKEKVESDGPIPEEEVRRLALLMTDILTYLHERTPPVVHRDFTPDNLILTGAGRLKLIDFDVAMEQSNFSQTNATIVGKQAYIPLEQFRGKPCPQSDIYALGATLTFLLTGEEPSAIQASHPRLINHDVSEDLDNIIAAATEADLNTRTADARTLAQQLRGES